MPLSYDKNNPVMIPAGLLLGSLDAAAELGVPLDETLRVSGVSLRQLQTGEGGLPLHQVVTFLNDGAERFNCEHFGFLIGKHQPPARWAMIGQLLRFCATIGDAIDDAIRLQMLNSGFASWSLEGDEELALLVRRTRLAYDAPMTQMQTLAVVSVFKTMIAVGKRPISLRRVLFSHRAPEDPRCLESYFGAPVTFNETVTALAFPVAELSMPITGHDPVVHRMLLAHLEALAGAEGQDEDLVSRLRRDIKQSVGSRDCNLEGACRRMGLHPRRLQRELRTQNLTFKNLLGDVRQELAEDYIRNSEISVLELSELLGYSNAGAFSRAFKLRTGLSPKHWKEAARTDVVK